MTAIEFTAIPDTDADYDLQLELLAEFRNRTGIEVKLTRMEWSDAWQQLINISTHGQGADISHVGSTWVSSLVSMNALRIHSFPCDHKNWRGRIVHPLHLAKCAHGGRAKCLGNSAECLHLCCCLST